VKLLMEKHMAPHVLGFFDDGSQPKLIFILSHSGISINVDSNPRTFHQH